MARYGKRTQKTNPAMIWIVTIVVCGAVLFLITKLLGGEPSQQVVGNAPAPYDVTLIYDPSVNYCKTGDKPMTIVLEPNQDVAAPVIGFYSDTLVYGPTGQKMGQISLAPFQAGVPVQYQLPFVETQPSLKHGLYIITTSKQSEASYLAYDMTPPKILPAVSGDKLQQNAMYTAQFLIANCGDIPLQQIVVEQNASNRVDVLGPNSYKAEDVSDARDKTRWHFFIDNIPSGTIMPVQFRYSPREITDTLIWELHIDKRRGRFGDDIKKDTVTMEMGPVS